jgi:hypothetical protein
MKDQYFGDVNDYRKYGLLRILTSNGGLRASVCWALTGSDGRSDGSRTGYLHQPSDWRRFDPQLYAFLHRLVLERDERCVEAIERSRVLPNCSFFRDLLPRDVSARDAFFSRLLTHASGADVIFFDPDNGLGVKSVPRGSRDSPKYVYPSELETAYRHGHSVLLYQHYPRRPREEFNRSISRAMGAQLGVDRVVAFSTSHVVFLLFPQPRHARRLEQSSARVARRWRGEISVKQYWADCEPESLQDASVLSQAIDPPAMVVA